jgi:hypothetical protein
MSLCAKQRSARMGKASELVGRAFEARLAKPSSIPVWFKVPTARDTRGKHLSPTWLDYVGSLPGGRMITADAKWRATAQRCTAGVLEPHQRVYADSALAAGALVLVIVGWVANNEVRVSVVPWQEARAGVDLVDWLTTDWSAACVELASRY